MTVLALVLVLLSAVLHATWNYFAKRTNGGATFVWLYDTVSLILYAPLLIGFYIWQRPTLSWLELAFILGCGMLHLAYFILLRTATVWRPLAGLSAGARHRPPARHNHRYNAFWRAAHVHCAGRRCADRRRRLSHLRWSEHLQGQGEPCGRNLWPGDWLLHRHLYALG